MFETRFIWKKKQSEVTWDSLLTELGGHPLQSALWGEARKQIDGIKDERWALYHREEPIALIRFERRGFGKLNKIAWVPQGPVGKIVSENVLFSELKSLGIMAYASLPWQQNTQKFLNLTSRQTVWIDLKLGSEQLWKNLHKQWRYGARQAKKVGVECVETQNISEVNQFFNLCRKISTNKQFKLNGSLDFLCFLLKHQYAQTVKAKLFIAKLHGELCAGAFVLIVGKHLHYMWGAVDRKFSKQRVGECLQWYIMEWGCLNNYALYDLEGIDEINNPGVSAFKKKMGGEVIKLIDPSVIGLTWPGRCLTPLIRRRLL